MLGDEETKCPGTGGNFYCANLTNDENHCGSCSSACRDDQVCINGICKTCSIANCSDISKDADECRCEKCKMNYHLTSAGTCENNTNDNCGSNEKPNATNCTDIISDYYVNDDRNYFETACQIGTGKCQCSLHGAGGVKSVCQCLGTDGFNEYVCSQNCSELHDIRYGDGHAYYGLSCNKVTSYPE